MKRSSAAHSGSSRSRSRPRSRRGGDRLALSVTAADEQRPSRRRAELSWLPAALGGGAALGLLGWVAVAGLAVVGWLGATAATSAAAMRTGAQLWFLAHGAGARVGGVDVTLVPLAVPLLLLLVLRAVGAYAARQLLRSDDVPVDLRRLDRGRLVRRVVSMVVLGYGGVMLVGAVLLGQGTQIGRAVVGSVLLAGIGSGWGAARAAGWRVSARWPGWVRAVPRAALTGAGAVVVVGVVVTAVALIRSAQQQSALSQAADLGVLGGAVMVVLQVLYVPNLVVWAGSYVLGAGFTLGDGSVASPVVTQLGLLPGLPITAAAPHDAIHGDAALLWLLAGALAGAAAAVSVLRGRPPARADETSLVGAVAGVLGGLGFVAVAALSRGDLGSDRLVGLGPRMPALFVMAVTVLGLGGLVTGLAWGLLRRERWLEAQRQNQRPDAEPTEVIRPRPQPRERPRVEWTAPEEEAAPRDAGGTVVVLDRTEPDETPADQPAGAGDGVDEESEPTRRVPRLRRD